MAQSKEDRKKSIAKSRRAHHDAQIEKNKRIDAYVLTQTKESLQTIKKSVPDINNEGQAIDWAVSLAMQSFERD
ncbi:hypothetical protein [Vibrio pectenicida]|uniref:Uncharacterized protein n=1 Tax=Vibrio pectenicida TaxID=62763 RepID=A0A427U588_9VIBR|nr:hypothetical protein [Vibrio pectenicida]RSD31732.1 hypothetical protein EJA03_07345 [Vibrio pectenicida]